MLFLSSCVRGKKCVDILCRKGEVCNDGKCYRCSTNQHFENGACVCDSGWYGWNCDKRCIGCQPNAHCEEDWCVCNNGWIGNECEVPVGSYAGTYHVTGFNYYNSMTVNNPPEPIDEIMVVTEMNGTLTARGYKHLYKPDAQNDSAIYSFVWQGPSPQIGSTVSFRRTESDSIYYNYYYATMASVRVIRLSGVRVR